MLMTGQARATQPPNHTIISWPRQTSANWRNQSKNHSQGTQGAGGVAKAQTELRISVPNCKQFFIHLHSTEPDSIAQPETIAQIFKQRILLQVMLRVAAALSAVP
jgi:hypothetical protein